VLFPLVDGRRRRRRWGRRQKKEGTVIYIIYIHIYTHIYMCVYVCVYRTVIYYTYTLFALYCVEVAGCVYEYICLFLFFFTASFVERKGRTGAWYERGGGRGGRKKNKSLAYS
jgi:hypothetical protein